MGHLCWIGGKFFKQVTIFSVAVSLIEVLKQYRWNEFALFYSPRLSSLIPRCSYIISDLEVSYCLK